MKDILMIIVNLAVVLLALTLILFCFFWGITAFIDKEYFIGIVMTTIGVLIVSGIGLFIIDEVNKNNSIKETKTVLVEVIEKEKENGRQQPIMIGKTTSFMYIQPKYNITISDGVDSKTYDNEDWYNSLQVGDKLEMTKKTYILNNKKYDAEFYFIEED